MTLGNVFVTYLHENITNSMISHSYVGNHWYGIFRSDQSMNHTHWTLSLCYLGRVLSVEAAPHRVYWGLSLQMWFQSGHNTYRHLWMYLPCCGCGGRASYEAAMVTSLVLFYEPCRPVLSIEAAPDRVHWGAVTPDVVPN
jgi:hypothetical protein